jgi:hypothetical protein
MPATSPPAIAPATSTAPIETHQRIAASRVGKIVTRQARREKQEHRPHFTFELAGDCHDLATTVARADAPIGNRPVP